MSADGDKWLDEYSGQSTDELIQLAKDYRTDSIVLAFEQALDQRAEEAGIGSLNEEERVVLAVEALEREVNNGGYEQFFINAFYDNASIVVAALNRIGCSECAALTQQAIDVLGIDGPVTDEALEQVMDEDDEEREEKLDELDDRYYEEIGDLSGPLLEFIKSNRDKIRL